MSSSITIIDVDAFVSKINIDFLSIQDGVKLRNALNLDNLDRISSAVMLQIPDYVKKISKNFYLGLLYKSYKKIGYENVHNKYRFTFSGSEAPKLHKDLSDTVVKVTSFTKKGL